jgi:peptidoglycan hydrolase-like protein with peptidoglycan-binding domain
MPTLRRVTLVLAFSLVTAALLLTVGGCAEEAESSESEERAVLSTIDTSQLPEIAEEDVFYHSDAVDDEGRHLLSPQDYAPEVAEIQQLFNEWDVPVGVSGEYDDDTLALVMAFQYTQGLVPDGVVGPNTWDAFEDPVRLPDDLDALEIVEIARVALTSPSDARHMIEEFEERTGFDPDGGEGAAGSEPAVGTPGVYAIVRLGSQHAQIYDGDDTLLHDFPISSGADGLTPVGEFAVQSRDEQAWAPGGETTMAWMTRFNGGIGFHGIPVKNGEALETPLGERPVSHGCIRMEDEHAKVVYDTLPEDAPVTVVQ